MPAIADEESHKVGNVPRETLCSAVCVSCAWASQADIPLAYSRTTSPKNFMRFFEKTLYFCAKTLYLDF